MDMVYSSASTESMTNPDIGIFSNNNYIPDIGQFNQQPRQEMVGVPPCLTATTSLTWSVGYPGSFTFAVPTQASHISAGLAVSTQPRGLYSSPLPYCVVPGIGASWQHAVPTHMPFGGSMTSQVNPTHIATFTGLTSLSSGPQTSICSPKQSFSETARRHKKRHASEDIESSSPTAKILMTEEKMAARMGNLSLSNANKQGHSSMLNMSSLPDLLLSSKFPLSSSKTLNNGLQRLQELEERLDDDASDENREVDDEENISRDRKLNFRLHIDHRVARKIFDPQPLLPKKILDDLNKPCLEVVLWKPPGGFQGSLPKTENNISFDSSQSKYIQKADEHIDRLFNCSSNDSEMIAVDMDTELFDSTDNDMQL